MTTTSFESASYSKHSNSYNQIKSDADELKLYKNWFENKTVDLWRHLMMFSIMDPLLNHYPDSTWITVGDGRFGTAATYIEKHGGKALATDIDISLLKIAQDEKMISSFALCNAEAMPFEANSFDFSYCKQSYHHFPRPFVALYEMIRVSKKAILLTEPADWIPLPVPFKILQNIKHFLKKLIKKQIAHHDTGNYEEVGNYIFTISEREIEKIALGLNLPAYAFKRFHDIYFPGVEQELYSQKGPLLKKTLAKARRRNLRCVLGLLQPNNIQIIIFKEKPDELTIRALKKDRFTYVPLPRNPYLEQTQ